MPVELSALFEREFAPVAQWIEQLTSDYPGGCAVARAGGGGANLVELSALFQLLRMGRDFQRPAVLPSNPLPRRTSDAQRDLFDERLT